MRHIAVLGFVVVALVFSACGGEGESDSAEATSQAAGVQASGQAATVKVTPRSSTATPGAASPAPTAAPAATPTAAPASQESRVAATSEEADECDPKAIGAMQPADLAICRAQDLRAMLDIYFGALNAYDVNGILPLLEDGYRAEQETAIRAQVDELKAEGTQLLWIEDQLPGKTGSRSMAMVITVEGDPSGTKEWVVGFLEIGARNSGEWVINLVNVKE